MTTLRQLLILATLPAVALAQPVTVLEEAFALDARTTYAAGTSAQWFSSAGSSNVVYTADTSITQNTGASGRHLLGYFTATPISLDVGDTLSVTFTITFNRGSALPDASNNFRFGLFDSSGGTRVSADNHGGTSASAVFDDYEGYAIFGNLGSTASNGLRVYERTSLTNQALIAGAGAYTQVGSGVTGQALSNNTAYTGTLTFERTDTEELSISYGLSGGALLSYTISAVDATPSTFSFDTLAFQMNSNTADGFTLSSVQIIYSPIAAPIPEPSTYAALVGLVSLGFVAVRRRRRTA